MRSSIVNALAVRLLAGLCLIGSGLAKAQTVSMADYFPDLTPGNVWVYSADLQIESIGTFPDQTATVSTAALVGGATPLERTSNTPSDRGDSRTYSITPTGLLLHREDFSLISTAFETPTSPVMLTPADITVGQTYPFTYDYNGQEPASGATWSGTNNGSIQILGFEIVTVPAGTFHTLKMTYATSWSESGSDDFGSFSATGGTTETWWMAMGLGVVRQESLTSSTYPGQPTVQFTAELTGTPLLIPGDTDFDGDIDDADLGTAISRFTGPVPAGGKLISEGDTNGDGDIDDADIGTLISGFTGPMTPASVPEPGAAGLLVLGGAWVCRRRRRAC